MGTFNVFRRFYLFGFSMFKVITMKSRLVFFISLLFLTTPALASLQVNMKNYKQSVTVGGSVTTSEINFNNTCGNSSTCNGGQHNEAPAITVATEGPAVVLSYVASAYPTCNKHYEVAPGGVFNAEQRADFTVWANSYLATNPIFYLTRGIPPEYAERVSLRAIYFRCKSPVNGVALHVQLYTDTGTIIDPIPKPSSCSFTTSAINLGFTSNNLTVNQTKTSSLNIGCTTGDPKNYKIRLKPASGTNVNSGRLVFGNGVLAQVSLNGINLNAGDDNSSVNITSSSVSTTLPVQVVLSGTASNSGYSTAQGILVLEEH